MRFADIRTEWRVDTIESTLRQKVDQHELSSTNSDVDRLGRSLREAYACIDQLRSELEATTSKLEQLENRLGWIESLERT